MGVRVRLGKNSSAYFPFWLAIPSMLLVAAFWAAVAGVVVAAWLVTAMVALPVAGIARLRHHDDTAARAIEALNWPVFRQH